MSRVLSRRALGLFWAGLVLAMGAGAGALHWLGPPEPVPEMVAQAEPEPPAAPPPAVPDPVPPSSPAAMPDPAAAPAVTALAPQPPAAQPAAPAPVPAAPAVAAPASGGAASPIAPPQAGPPPPASAAAVATPPAPAPAPPALRAAPSPPPLAAGSATESPAHAEPRIPPPDPELLERGRHGPLPRLGPENRTSIRTYARPFDREDRRPRIGLILGNVGLFAQHSEEAIRRLPGAVTLAFSPYALRPEPLLERARARGMEVLVALPLEPAGFGQDADPGDRALLTGLSVEDNLDRLDWVLSRIQGQVGAIGALGRLRGERFAANAELLGTIQAALTNRGLLYVDPRPGAPSPARAFGRTVDLVLDDPSETRSEVERRLQELEALAKRQGSALGLLGNPAPFFTAAILAWSAGLEQRGAVLAPVTVMLRRPAATAEPTRAAESPGAAANGVSR
ncbi:MULTISPECIES: divergent polysaccharide deacetylase family protein [Roseomonadaceae]|uniref:Divergent polysaccharide deacetylase family protein n=1 Tax=Falsiroseomonas oleicola TaxID=2801474 RepID=A0ABS6H758_9PROT|nr:divergent polysaccharide deacetylase family protein [Roseomonas oleicola]MBU8544537.1 divergent polysaccharide deacetylase family protein [Roseomonas oleicola]